jgi:hypothetical protein
MGAVAPQSVFVQQLPATHAHEPGAPAQSAVPPVAQQKSPPFAEQMPDAEQLDETQAPLVVLQMVVEP